MERAHKKKPTSKLVRYMLSVGVTMLSLASHKAFAFQQYPLIFPASVDGIGYFLGAGYGTKELINTETLAALGYVGQMQGASLTANNWTLVDDWLTLDSRIIYLNKFTPLSNYSRSSKKSENTFKPSLKVTSFELALHSYYQNFRFSLIPGVNVTKFDSFNDKNGDAIAVDSIHITDLNQPYAKVELGYRLDVDQLLDSYYFDANLRYISQNQSSGYSGSNIFSSTFSGQYNFSDGIGIFGQIFTTDATPVKNSIQGESAVAETLDMECSNDKCSQLRSALISYISEHNKYGTAEPLGGPERMKAYPVNYFRAAHARYFTAEFRITEKKLFDNYDLFLHVFDETATVDDDQANLFDDQIKSTGLEVGVNLDKGFVYKLTAATGDLGWTGHLTFARSW